MKFIIAIVCLIVFSSHCTVSYAHTLDSYENYRLEIGWENDPPYSGEINAVLIYVSPLIEGINLEEQPFENGVTDLEDTLKMEILNRDGSITLFLTPSDVDGKYRGFVKIDKPGFYQVNLIGEIEGTPISLSMHPPQVRNSEHIAFPPSYGLLHDTVTEQQALQEQLENLNSTLDFELSSLRNEIESSRDNDASLVAIILGGAGVALGVAALVRGRVRN